MDKQNDDTFRAIENSARLIKQIELHKSGLVIIQALYGDLINFGEAPPSTNYRPGKCIDISMQLQANVSTGNLHCLGRGVEPFYKRMPDIPNPNGAEKKQIIRNRLAIIYWFDGNFHHATFNDTDTLVLPLQDHQIEMVIDDGTYPDLIAIAEEAFPHWVDLIPSPEDDDFELIGANWDADYVFEYQHVPPFMPHYSPSGQKVYPAPLRPEGVLSEPRFIVYERQLRAEDKKAKKQLLLGVGAVGVLTLGALQLTGMIDITTWPGINMIFGGDKSKEVKKIELVKEKNDDGVTKDQDL